MNTTGVKAFQNVSNGLNIANMLQGATNGKNAGQRIAGIIPAIMSML